jgi:hypothetical protein
MRRAFAALGFLSVLASAALSLTVLPSAETRAAGQPSGTFVVPANDGYGVAGCLMNGGDCGKIVANAWCEAHGFRRAEAFSLVRPEEVTGSATPIRVSDESERPVAITCAN